MSSKEYHKISSSKSNAKWNQNGALHNSEGSHKKGMNVPSKPHEEYEYFQLFDPDDSDIEDEDDPDVRSLLVSRITSYTILAKSKSNKCCSLKGYMIIHSDVLYTLVCV